MNPDELEAAAGRILAYTEGATSERKCALATQILLDQLKWHDERAEVWHGIAGRFRVGETAHVEAVTWAGTHRATAKRIRAALAEATP